MRTDSGGEWLDEILRDHAVALDQAVPPVTASEARSTSDRATAPRFVRRRRQSARRLAIAFTAVAICSLIVVAVSLVRDEGPPSPAEVLPAFDGSVRGQGSVMQTGTDRPVFCAPTIRVVPAFASGPPEQCRGVPITNWDWDLVPWRQSSGHTTWADARVEGTYSDGVLAVEGAPLEPLPTQHPSTGSLFSNLCDGPDGDPGHDAAEWEATTQDHPRVNSIVGVRTMWVSNPAPGPVVVNVVASPGTSAAVRREIRDLWQGLLCVEERDLPTQEQLEDIRSRLPAVLGQTVWQSSTDTRRGIVEALIDVATPAAVAKAQQAFGPGVVVLNGVLTPR